MVLKICGASMVVALAVACQADRSHADVTRYFAAGRVGASPDVGIFQQGAVTGSWDLIGVIHSMTDDMDFCQTLVDALQAQRNINTYACRLLN